MARLRDKGAIGMTSGRRAVWAAAFGLGLVGVGCGGGEATSLTSATTPSGLVGPTWRLTKLGGQPVIDGTTVTAEFSDESRVAGKASCNQYFGSARAEEGGRLAVGPLASTMMACSPQGVMDQETRYLAALQAATTFVVSGEELRLGPAGAAATLVFSSR
jgi:heat shock protein HslJ